MSDTTNEPSKSRAWAKPAVFATVALVCGVAYWQFGDSFTLKNLATYEDALRDYEQANPWKVIFGAFALYVLVSGLSIPGGAVALSLVYGSYFGWGKAVGIVSFASTAGATVAFLTSRYLFRDFVQSKFGSRLVGINQRLADEGAFYLFSLRLIVAVPFFMLNLLMGLTNMKWTTYWWVSQLGMLPGTMAYVYAGSTLKLTELAEHGFDGIGWQTLVAFGILGVLPITIKKLMSYVSRGNGNAAAPI